MFQRQTSAEFADRLIVLRPQCQHDEILGIGQADVVEQRLIDPIEGMARGIDGKAKQVGGL